jgi:AcrR family transcriptional regulator
MNEYSFRMARAASRRSPSPRPRRGAGAPPDRRAAIVRASLELMSERSFGSTPVPEIAARAGVAAGTVYVHFPSKEALVNAVYRECKLELRARLRAALEGADGAREAVRRLWRGLYRFSQESPDALRFLELHRHQPYLDRASRALARALFDEIAAVVRDGQRAGELREGPAEVLVALAFGAFVGMLKEADAGHVALGPEALDASEAAVWSMLRA